MEALEKTFVEVFEDSAEKSFVPLFSRVFLKLMAPVRDLGHSEMKQLEVVGPEIELPPSIYYTTGVSGQVITWTRRELNSRPLQCH